MDQSAAATPPLRHRALHLVARRAINPCVVAAGLAGGRHSPIGLVLHVGRRSGHEYATPLAVHRLGDHLLIPLTYGPAARWVLNVLAAGGCRIRLHGTEITAVRPRVVGRGALTRGWRAAYTLVGMHDFLALEAVAAREVS